MTPEGKVKAEIKRYLKARGAYFFMPVQTGYGSTSLDFLVCLNGRFIGIEAKSLIGQPTPRQLAVMREIMATGGFAMLARSAYDVDHAFQAQGI